MKQIVSELDQKGMNSEFNKITDEYTFIEEGKNIDKAQTSVNNIDDSKKIDIRTDYNNEQKWFMFYGRQLLRDKKFMSLTPVQRDFLVIAHP